MTKSYSKSDIVAQLVSNMQELKAALDTRAANDMVFAWDGGLGVKLVGTDPKPSVVGLLQATRLTYGRRLVFTNGAGQAATWVQRGTAIRAQIEKLGALIDTIEATPAKEG